VFAVAVSPYEYDAGEPWVERKHAPRGAEPSWKKSNGKVITTCPNTFDKATAKTLLNDERRFEWREPRDPTAHPDAIWMIHDGVLYRAEPTNVGVSFHGFPETKAKLDDCLTKKQQRALFAWAEALGTLRELKAWLAKTEGWK